MATPNEERQGADEPLTEAEKAAQETEEDRGRVDVRFDADPGNDDEVLDVAELQEKAARADELHDQLQRISADLKNFQRRALRDKEAARRFAIRDLVGALLPSFDSLDRALETAEPEGDSAGLLEGVKLVKEGLLRALEDRGINVVNPSEGPVDPNVHEAVVRQPTPGVPENHIVAVLEKGYVLDDLVIRAARVVVSAGEPAPPANNETSGDDAPEDES